MKTAFPMLLCCVPRTGGPTGICGFVSVPLMLPPIHDVDDLEVQVWSKKTGESTGFGESLWFGMRCMPQHQPRFSSCSCSNAAKPPRHTTPTPSIHIIHFIRCISHIPFLRVLTHQVKTRHVHSCLKPVVAELVEVCIDVASMSVKTPESFFCRLRYVRTVQLKAFEPTQKQHFLEPCTPRFSMDTSRFQLCRPHHQSILLPALKSSPRILGRSGCFMSSCFIQEL